MFNTIRHFRTLTNVLRLIHQYIQHETVMVEDPNSNCPFTSEIHQEWILVTKTNNKILEDIIS